MTERTTVCKTCGNELKDWQIRRGFKHCVQCYHWRRNSGLGKRLVGGIKRVFRRQDIILSKGGDLYAEVRRLWS